MAGLTLSQFIERLRRICDQSALVVSYDVRVLDNAVTKTRVFLTIDASIDVYYNPVNSTCSYTLIQDNQRIFGADNAFVGWHIHPFENPDEHRLCEEVRFEEFLNAIEQWIE